MTIASTSLLAFGLLLFANLSVVKCQWPVPVSVPGGQLSFGLAAFSWPLVLTDSCVVTYISSVVIAEETTPFTVQPAVNVYCITNGSWALAQTLNIGCLQLAADASANYVACGGQTDVLIYRFSATNSMYTLLTSLPIVGTLCSIALEANLLMYSLGPNQVFAYNMTTGVTSPVPAPPFSSSFGCDDTDPGPTVIAVLTNNIAVVGDPRYSNALLLNAGAVYVVTNSSVGWRSLLVEHGFKSGITLGSSVIRCAPATLPTFANYGADNSNLWEINANGSVVQIAKFSTVSVAACTDMLWLMEDSDDASIVGLFGRNQGGPNAWGQLYSTVSIPAPDASSQAGWGVFGAVGVSNAYFAISTNSYVDPLTHNRTGAVWIYPVGCQPGYFGQLATQGSCSECPAGSYSGAGASVCSSCGLGTYSSDPGASTASACTVCPAGTYCNVTGLSAALQCAAGFFGTAQSAMNCSSCPAGTFNLNTGASSAGACVPCSTGSYCVEATGSPIGCPPGTFSLATGASSSATCLPCSAGHTSTVGSTRCVPCPPGTYSLVGLSSCQPCQPGSYSTTGASVCTSCAAGFYCSASQQTPCPIGTFSAATNASAIGSCFLCAPGRYCAQTNMTEAIPCPVGTWGTTFGATTLSACLPCQMNSYANTSGNTNCSACPDASYCPLASRAALPASLLMQPTFSAVSNESYFNGLTDTYRSNSYRFAVIVGGSGLGLVLLALIIVLVLLCGTSGKTVSGGLSKVDFLFATAHATPPGTPVIPHKTALGGFFTIVFAACEALLLVILIGIYFLYNVEATNQLQSGAIAVNTTLSGSALFVGYGGACQTASVVPTDLTGKFTQTPTMIAQTGPGSMPGCNVIWQCESCSLLSTSAAVNITLQEVPGAYAAAIEWSFSASPVIPGNDNLNSGLFLPDGDPTTTIFRSSSAPSTVVMTLFPTKYANLQGGSTTGYLAFRSATQVGTVVDSSTFFSSDSVGMVFELQAFAGYAAVAEQQANSWVYLLTQIASLTVALKTAVTIAFQICEQVWNYTHRRLGTNVWKRTAESRSDLDVQLVPMKLGSATTDIMTRLESLEAEVEGLRRRSKVYVPPE
eukprot:TRINITY_DN2250_c0_g1_i1.p1 TRINITY_DN2250_c0_g1~~TRINITY_DN2250_c0_g1_i1.p1  ORF type:complete len:1110 (+),score=143.24 TRINITY_DN2250_c0_g1_i1:55-3330(+)